LFLIENLFSLCFPLVLLPQSTHLRQAFAELDLSDADVLEVKVKQLPMVGTQGEKMFTISMSVR
jgi:hypothetical protein